MKTAPVLALLSMSLLSIFIIPIAKGATPTTNNSDSSSSPSADELGDKARQHLSEGHVMQGLHDNKDFEAKALKEAGYDDAPSTPSSPSPSDNNSSQNNTSNN